MGCNSRVSSSKTISHQCCHPPRMSVTNSVICWGCLPPKLSFTKGVCHQECHSQRVSAKDIIRDCVCRQNPRRVLSFSKDVIFQGCYPMRASATEVVTHRVCLFMEDVTHQFHLSLSSLVSGISQGSQTCFLVVSALLVIEICLSQVIGCGTA